MNMEQLVEWELVKDRNIQRKPAPVSFCSPQIPYDPISNPSLRGGEQVTNRLQYGAGSG
jgi:hypothetical protein